MEATTEELAQELVDDYNRVTNATLMFHHRLEQALELPEAEREAVARILDPTGKVLHRRADGDGRQLTYMDIQDLMYRVGQCRGPIQALVGKPIFDDNHPVIVKKSVRKSAESTTGLVGKPSINGWTVPETSTASK